MENLDEVKRHLDERLARRRARETEREPTPEVPRPRKKRPASAGSGRGEGRTDRKKRRFSPLELFLLLSLALALIVGVVAVGRGIGLVRSVAQRSYSALADSPGGTAALALIEEERLTDEEKLEKIRTDRDTYPDALRALAEDNGETLNYVYYYPELHSARLAVDLTQELSGGVPALYQYDLRWGYASYGPGALALTGDGPTCLSMAALALTGDEAYTPDAVAAYAEQNGYFNLTVGTTWSLMTQGSAAFGLSARELERSAQAMRDALREGAVLICYLTAEEPEAWDRYVVVTGYGDEGFVVHDPASAAQTAEGWGTAALVDRLIGVCALSVA